MDPRILGMLKARARAAGGLQIQPETPPTTPGMMPPQMPAPNRDPASMPVDILGGPPMDTQNDGTVDAMDQLQQAHTMPGSLQEKLKMLLQRRGNGQMPNM